jgi:hypothetical protein
MKHPHSHRLVHEHELGDLIENLDEAIALLEDLWTNEGELLTRWNAGIHRALTDAAEYLHQLRLQQTA